MTIGELIRSIQKPVSIYVDEIVKAFHKMLRKDLQECKRPAQCSKKTNDRMLCESCTSWLSKLKASHKKGENSLWFKNCKSSQWSKDPWEVAKYFMPPLGSNPSAVKDAESTDLSSLLNVLEWMDAKFLGNNRIDVNFVRKLRSQVRNIWAHAARLELTENEKNESFSIAINFVSNLENVYPKGENVECLKYLENLKTDGVTKIHQSELDSLLLLRDLLENITEEMTNIKVERSIEKDVMNEHQQKLDKLQRALKECSRKMRDFKNFADELKAFPDEIHKIRNRVEQILAKINKRQRKQEPKSCLPDKLSMFTGREDEIENVISLLTDKEMAVVSLYGGPGFGKTAIAIQLSHKLNEDHKIPVIFSQLTTATNEEEMIRQLCIDVGVNHEDDPKSSLILWLNSIKKKVVLVMSDIDNLLDEKSRSCFYNFIRLLRKNSTCQIVTASRRSYLIPELAIGKVPVEEMEDNACMELLKKQCPKQDEFFLKKLAERCGYVPLAMCIAASLVDEFEDPNELLQYLEHQPMKILENPESDQYVKRAIDVSYEKCSDTEKETLIRLSVFEENFNKDAAEVVMEKDKSDTRQILTTLVSRSLVKRPTKNRYSIHLLIKHFLKEKRTLAAARRAEVLMVEYYLELGHQLTMKSYSKDGYKDAREALKREAYNIHNVLKICCQQVQASSDISDCLARSKIYDTSANFFSLFVRTIIPGSIVDEFLQQCAKMADERKQHAIKINFDCSLANPERSTTIDEHFTFNMEEIKREFEAHSEKLKEDQSLCAHYYSQYGKYLLRQSESENGEKQELQIEALKQLEKSLELRNALTGTAEGKADKIFSLLQLGNTRASILHDANNLELAKKHYEEAIQLSETDLGEHDLTSACYQSYGDLFLKIEKPELAEQCYITAKNMRENLGLDASGKYIFLLNNLGICLTKSNRADEAIKVLESARKTAVKLAETDKPTVCKTKVYTSLAIAHDLEQKDFEAVYYAKKAMEFGQIQKTIKNDEYKKLQEIVQIK